MKKTAFFDNKKDISQWLLKYHIENFIIQDDLTVDVNQDVEIKNDSQQKIQHLPIQFGEIKGDFLLNGLGLNTLKGCPHSVLGDFNVSHNELTHLDYFPKIIKNSIYLSYNKLTTVDLRQLDIKKLSLSFNLIDSLKNIHNYSSIETLHIGGNNLIDLDGCPDVKALILSYMYPYDDTVKLSLKGISKNIISLNLWDSHIDHIEELEDCHHLKKLVLAKNLTNLQHIPPFIKELDLSGNDNLRKTFEVLNFSHLTNLSVASTHYDGRYLTRYFEQLKLEQIKEEQERLNSLVSDNGQVSLKNKLKI